MTKLKLLSIAALLSAAITSPVLAQQAVQNRERQRSTKASVSGRITTRPRMRLLTPAISIGRWSRRRLSAMCAVRRGMIWQCAGRVSGPVRCSYWRRPKG